MKKNILHWNLLLNPHEYPKNIKEEYFQLYLNSRKSYTSWIGEISKNFKQNIDWWSSIPASRNIYYSNLHKNISILETLKNLSKKYEKIAIRLDSDDLREIIKKWSFKKKINIDLKFEKKTLFFYRNFLYFFNSFIFNLTIFFYINLFIKKINLKFKSQKDKIVLIDLFATDKTLKKKNLYNNLDIYLEKKNIRNVFFVPTFVITRNIFKVFKIINNLNDKNYIFKEHYLSIKDVFYSGLHSFRKKKFLIKYKKYKEWDLSPCLHTEINNNINCYSEQTSIINYLFVKKLMLKKIKIYKVINWFENQTIDKGWNMGFRQFYKNEEIIGYQGFLHYSQYMNTFVTSFEEKAKVIPKKIISIGKAYIKLKKEFFPKAKIILGPALNYTEVFKNYKKTRKIKILVILSGIKHLDKVILDWVKYFLKRNKKFNVFIKPHPMYPISDTYDQNNQIKITNQNLSELLKKTDTAICSGPTGGSIESLAYSCYLICLVLDPCDNVNLNSLKIKKKYFKLIENKQDLFKEIEKIYNKKKKFKFDKKIKNFLFEKLTDKNMQLFYK